MNSATNIPDDPPFTPAPLLLTVQEAAEALRLSERTLFRCIKKGTLRVVHVGRALRLDPADLRVFIERQKGIGHE